MADTLFLEIHEVRKDLWASFLDCASRMLIGWTGKLRSHGITAGNVYAAVSEMLL